MSLSLLELIIFVKFSQSVISLKLVKEKLVINSSIDIHCRNKLSSYSISLRTVIDNCSIQIGLSLGQNSFERQRYKQSVFILVLQCGLTVYFSSCLITLSTTPSGSLTSLGQRPRTAMILMPDKHFIPGKAGFGLNSSLKISKT